MAIFYAINWEVIRGVNQSASEANLSEVFSNTWSSNKMDTVDGRLCLREVRTTPQILDSADIPSWPSSVDTIIWQGYWYPDSAALKMMSFREGATYHTQITKTATGTIKAFRGNSVTELGESTETYTADTWQYLQVKVKVHDTAGSVKVIIDGVTFLDLTNQDTRTAATGVIDGMDFWSEDNANNIRNRWAEMFFADTSGSIFNDLSPDVAEIGILLPDGAGNATEWTASAGSNWSNVNDADGGILDESDYNESSTDTHKDTFAMEASPSASPIYAVVPYAIGQIVTSGTFSVNTVSRHSSSEGAGSDKAFVLNTLKMAQHVQETNPSTSAAWTTTEVSAMEAGYELST